MERLTSGQLAPVVDVEGSDGRVPGTGKIVLVHFWATRCPPCRFDLHAVSVDEDWATVERYFGVGWGPAEPAPATSEDTVGSTQ